MSEVPLCLYPASYPSTGYPGTRCVGPYGSQYRRAIRAVPVPGFVPVYRMVEPSMPGMPEASISPPVEASDESLRIKSPFNIT